MSTADPFPLGRDLPCPACAPHVHLWLPCDLCDCTAHEQTGIYPADA